MKWFIQSHKLGKITIITGAWSILTSLKQNKGCGSIIRSIYFYITIFIFPSGPILNPSFADPFQRVQYEVNLYMSVIKISETLARSSYVYKSLLTFQSGPISNCVLSLTAFLRRSSIEWIYSRFLNRKLHGLRETLKLFASMFLFIMDTVKFLDQFHVSAMFIHWIFFNFIVGKYQILKD